MPSITSGTLATGDVPDFSEAYSTKNVGTGLTLTAGGCVNDGNSGSDYSVTFATSTAGQITARALTVTALTSTKIYDGSTSSAVIPTLVSGTLVAGDTAAFSESFDTKNVGTGKTLVPGGSVTDGNGGSNYTLTFNDDATGQISTRAITVLAITSTKGYDGTTSSATTPAITGGSLVGGDTAAFSETYATKNVGTGLTLTATGSVNDGNSGGNYAVSFTPVATGSITTRAITVTAVANSKVYDGTTSAAAVPTISSGSLVGGDTATFSESYSTKNAGTGLTLTPTDSINDGNGGSNYTVTLTPITTGVISARAITVTAAANSKVYDGTTSAAALPTISSGSLVGGDTATFSESYGTKNVGTGLTLTPTDSINDGNGGSNYAVTLSPIATGVISARAITVTAVANSKVYDGTTSAAALPTISSGSLVGGDTATFNESYGTKNVGTGLTLTPTDSINDGNSGSNYSVTLTPVATGVISAQAITVTADTSTKIYDGATSATVLPTITGGSLVGSDTAAFSETYATKNVGTGMTLSVAGSVVDGNSGSNYTVTLLTDATGSITARGITVTAATNTKVFDGTTSAAAKPTVSGNTLAGGDTASFSETYNTSALGTGLTLTPAGSVVDGNSGNNYAMSFAVNTTGAITSGVATTTIVSSSLPSVVYGALVTFTATVSASSSAPSQGSVDFYDTTASHDLGNGTFVTSSGTSSTWTLTTGVKTFNVTTGDTITASYSPGTGFGGSSGTTTQVITARALTVTAVASSKGYDGTTASTATPSITGGTLVGSDAASFGESFATKNVGAGRTLAPGGSVIDGNSGSNYNVTFTPVATGQISARAITVTAVTSTKVYDGTTASAVSPAITGGSLATGDSAAFSETYNTKNVGTGRTLAPTGSVIDGNSGSNYTVSFANVATGQVTAMAITVTAVTGTKGYDGTTASAVLPAITGGSLATGDTVAFSETYTTKNAGTGLTLAPSGSVNDANGGNNYTVSMVNDTTGSITARAITVTAVVNSKVYDGTTSAAALPTVTGSLATGDTATFSESYGTKNVGTGLTLTPTDSINDGNGGSNYTVTLTPITTGVISARAITVTAVVNSKVYDGTTSAAALPTVTGSLATGDTATFSESYGTKNAGTGLTLAPADSINDGNGGSNYAVTLRSITTGVISAQAITLTAVTNSKVYDGTTSAAALPTITAGSLVAGDTATFSESYGTKNVGAGLTLTPADSINDGNGGSNYAVTLRPITTGEISARTITVTAATNTKGYDGTTLAAAAPTVSGSLATGDTAAFSETYNTKNVGTGMTLAPVGSVNDGNSGNNYAVTVFADLTGAITVRNITVTAVTNTKVFDGTTSAAAKPTISTGSLATGDTAAFSETYNTSALNTGLTLTPAGSVIDGNSGNNYAVSFVVNTTGAITNGTNTTTVLNTSQASAVYGTALTFTATVTADAGTVAPAQGSVDFYDTTTSLDLGNGSFVTSSGTTSTWTLATGVKSFNVTSGDTITASYSPGTGFGGSSGTTTQAITARPLTITAVANSKVYDGTTASTATPSITGGSLVGSDTAAFGESFATKNVGAGRTLAPGGSVIDGNSGSNYTLNFVNSTAGQITARAITVTAATSTKAYDGTTSTAITPAITSGSLATGDTANFSETYATKNVGTGKTLTATGLVADGNSGSNYSVSFLSNTTGQVTALAITVTAASASKTYDGSTSSTTAPAITSGSLAGSDTAAFSESYNTKNVGTGMTLTAAGSVNDGNGGSNYAVTLLSDVTGSIAARAITVTAATNTKSFDGTTSAAAKPTITSGSLATGDTAAFSETYNTSAINTGLTLTPAGSVSDGNSGNNYAVSFVVNTTGVITSGIGTTTTVKTSQPSVVYGTAVTFTATVTAGSGTSAPTQGSVDFYDTTTSHDLGNGSFVTSSGTTATWTLATVAKSLNVTTGDTITATYLPGSGYSGSFGTVSQAITPRAITVTAATNTKGYDGTTASTANPAVTGGSLVAGDSAAFSETFDTGNVGTGKTLSAAGSVNDGDGGSDYAVTFVTNKTGRITARAITVTAATDSKGYDGTTSAAALPAITAGSLVLSDTAVFTESFTSKNAGTGRTLVAAGSVNDGNGGSNYAVTFAANATGAIAARTLTVTALSSSKGYDGTVLVPLAPAITSGSLAIGDTAAFAETFDTKNVGTNKALTPGGSVSDGNGGNNYSVTFLANVTGQVTARAITVTAATNTKGYDGTFSAAAKPVINAGGLASGDTAVFSETYNTSAMGTGLTLTPAGSVNDGNGGNDYAVTFVANTTGTINTATPKLTQLIITENSASTVVSGHDVVYTITLKNVGQNPAQNVVVTDTLGTGVTYLSDPVPAGFTASTPAVGSSGVVIFTATQNFAAGASVTFTIVGLVSPTAGSGTPVSNKVCVKSDNTASNSVTTAGMQPQLNAVGASLSGSSLGNGKTDLVVTGTGGSDAIYVLPTTGNQLLVLENGHQFGPFAAPTGRIVVYSGNGNDLVYVSPLLSEPSWIFGGIGNNVFYADSGNSVLVGGCGNNVLVSGRGSNLLIGGSGGRNEILGTLGNNIEVGGSVSYQSNEAALAAVMAEWSSGDTYATRVGTINGNIGGGLNGSWLLNASTITHGSGYDYLFGGIGQNTYFAHQTGSVLARDYIFGQKSSEIATPI